MHHDQPADPDRPVLPWRLVAGVLLHVAVPAYLIVLATAWLVAGPTTVTGPASLRFVARTSGLFVAGFAGLIVLASAVAALADPPLRRARARRERADPAAAARRAAAGLTRALARADAIGGTATAAAVRRLRAARWDLTDEQDRAIAADLSGAVTAFAAAQASAAPDRRGAIADQAAAALDRVAAAVEQRAAERARLDEGDAQTHARYLAARFPHSALDPAGPDRD